MAFKPISEALSAFDSTPEELADAISGMEAKISEWRSPSYPGFVNNYGGALKAWAEKRIRETSESPATQASPRTRADHPIATMHKVRAIVSWFNENRGPDSAYDRAYSAEMRNSGKAGAESLYQSLWEAVGPGMYGTYDHSKASRLVWDLRAEANHLGSKAHAELADEIEEMLINVGVGKPMPIRQILASAADLKSRDKSLLRMNGWELLKLKHFRPMLVIRGVAGILFNSLRGIFKYRDQQANQDLVEMTILEGEMNGLLESAGAAGIKFEALKTGVYNLMSFGEADTDQRIARVNMRLPAEMRLVTLIHETLHILHPEWTEAQVVGETDSYRAVRRAQLKAMPQTIQTAAQAEAAASPRTAVSDLLTILPIMLENLHLMPKEATSARKALDTARQSIINAAA